MAAFTFGLGHPFPVGTLVRAYEDKGQNPSGSPMGVSVASATVAADSSLTISGLTEGKRYWAVAQVDGVWRWVHVNVRTSEAVPGEVFEVEDEGALLPTRRRVNFVGAGVSAQDDAANERTVVSVAAAPVAGSVPPGVYDVTAAPYNADKLGLADSTAAIQAAIDACKAEGGGVVYFPPGRYIISSPGLNMDSTYWGVSLQGAGKQLWTLGYVSLLDYVSATGSLLSIRSIHSCRVDLLQFRASHNAYNPAVGLVDMSSTGSDPMMTYVENCKFEYTGSGVTARAGLSTSRNIITCVRHCDFKGFKYNLEIGREAYNVVNQVEGNHFSGGPDGGYHIYAPNGASEALGINWNTFEPRGALGHCNAIYLGTVFQDGFSCIGNWFGDIAVADKPAIEGSIRGGLIAANKFAWLGTGVPAIKLVDEAGSGSCAIIGNQCQADHLLQLAGGVASGIVMLGNKHNGSGSRLLGEANAYGLLDLDGMRLPGAVIGGPGDGTPLIPRAHQAGDAIAFGKTFGAGAEMFDRASAVIWQHAGDGSLILQPATNAPGAFVRVKTRSGAGASAERLSVGDEYTQLQAIRMQELAALPAAVIDGVILAAEDNGAGKTRLVAKFPTGNVTIVTAP